MSDVAPLRPGGGRGRTGMGIVQWRHHGPQPCRIALYTTSGCARLSRVRGKGDSCGRVQAGIVFDLWL